MLADGPVDVIGFVYCPPGWDEQRLRAGPDADAIRTIAIDTYTDIAYIKEKNSIQITGESHDDVYKAQNQLNTLFFPVIVKSKRQWARPDRPGVWGQRRDLNSNSNQPSDNNQNNRYSNSQSGIRKMKSEPALHNRHTFNGFSNNNNNNNNGQSPFAKTSSFKPQQLQQSGTQRQQWQPNNFNQQRNPQQPQQQPQQTQGAAGGAQLYSQNTATGWR